MIKPLLFVWEWFAAMKVAGWTNAVSRKRDRLIPLKINYGKKVK